MKMQKLFCARRVRIGLGVLCLLAACGHMHFAERPHATARFETNGPGAAEYRSEPTRDDALRGPHAFRVGAGIEQATRGQPLTPDGRLGALAEQIAAALDANAAPPPYAAIDLWAHHLGLFEPVPHLIVLAQSDASTLADRVRSEIEQRLAQQRYTHFGAATLERDGTVFAVLALSWRWAAITPVSRVQSAGATIEMSGELSGGLHTPQFVVSLPDGTSQRQEPQQGKKFSLRMPTQARGEYRVELLAESDLGETVVANFPIYVGVPAATSVVVGEDGAGAPSDLGEQPSQERLLALINADRKHAGLPELTHNDALARVARAHDVDMQTHGFIGHTSKTTGDAADRVKRAGIRTPLVLENIGRGYSPDEVHRGLMDSPGHRANVLSAEATDVGIGVLLVPEDDRNAYLVTEVFGRFARKIDIGDATSDLFESVDRERAKRGLTKLAHDDTLSELCARAALHFFADPHSARQVVVEQLNRDAFKKKLRFTKLGALMTVVTRVDEAATIDALLDPKARALGLGLAQGTRPDTFENAIAVVILIAY
jgi:uncharacterized protein YkwD